MQIEVCKLVGLQAKRRGQSRNRAWKTRQTLWWKGIAYKRDIKEYQDLLDRLYDARATNPNFRAALFATSNAVLTHSIGKKKKQDTVLTEQELCSRLMKLRAKLKSGWIP